MFLYGFFTKCLERMTNDLFMLLNLVECIKDLLQMKQCTLLMIKERAILKDMRRYLDNLVYKIFGTYFDTREGYGLCARVQAL